MSDVTHILEAIGQGDPRAAEQLLPLVYDELRRLAARKLAHERPGQTLDATALIHEVQRQGLDEFDLALPQMPDDVVSISEALDRLAARNAQAAELVKLRFFAGLTNDEAAEVLGVSPRKATQVWAYARAWLLENLGHEPF
jgi:DNA-directed RNA polymerase specialized sigma24 family protein